MTIWRRVLAVAALLALAAPAPAAVTWTCTQEGRAVQPEGYISIGSCRASGTYTTGGDAVGSAATAASAAKSFCGETTKFVVDLVASGAMAPGGTAGVLPVLDTTAWKLQALCGAASGANLAQCTAGNTLTDMVFRFYALCK